jgi:hypothetical protein
MRMSAASAYEKEKVVKRSMQEVAEELVQAAREGGVEVGKSVVIMMFFHVESLNEDVSLQPTCCSRNSRSRSS